MNRKDLVNYILLNSKYSIDEISTKIKVDRSNVYLWKKGKSKPKVDNINKMAAITGHDIKWLNEDKIEVINSGNNSRMKALKTNDNADIISLQSENIHLLKEKVKMLEDELQALKLEPSNKSNWKINFSTFNIYSFITFKNKKDYDKPG